jgi:hypothetical protein
MGDASVGPVRPGLPQDISLPQQCGECYDQICNVFSIDRQGDSFEPSEKYVYIYSIFGVDISSEDGQNIQCLVCRAISP